MSDALDVLREGTVVPAHPLALDAGRRLDERRQRALTRYYMASGAGGVAVAVHTTQFEIREPGVGLLRPVLELAAETVRAEAGRPFVMVAGACGYTAQAVAEAELAASLGYDAVLLSPAVPGADEKGLLERARAVGEVLPVIGFYLQEAVGGRYLSPSFWSAFADLPSTVAVKIAPFDRYRTADVIRAVGAADRADEVALYTGNDDDIIGDLLTPYGTAGGRRWFAGGLLGQWAVWTRSAAALLEDVRAARAGDHEALLRCLTRRPELTDANQAVFDVRGAFRGCIAGVHEVLRRQGLLAGTWCLDPAESLSPGQAEELTRVAAAYPWLTDDAFVKEHLDDWLR
ncbi:dihydrodipicolinate synthase family protein [Streptomyces sp. VRA16 Mangrove soil]|uniref:dihydrodipicolinate synthase family protein n=1 Tax=Streptomyces sp. VRA16 Mangrove soil TaxID=2817434 RepID=UPI001A9F3E93|nr:dihydrodipicolinate synthase family protein [Streptomyces sp. VRA16 Mangrove soil]MBO1330061.1 dihydrodipicolinate synthase family protein [Streptomyces sp. VRA16 Mangrove soil]